jgi:conjugative transfer signal peptidase TraF
MKQKKWKPLTTWQKAYVAFVLLSLFSLLTYTAYANILKPKTVLGFIYNPTHSCPSGLYHTYQTPLKKGVIVQFCPPMTPMIQEWEKRGYLVNIKGNCPGRIVPWMKPIAAMPGDIIRLDKTGANINGRHLPNSAPMYEDSKHRPMHPYPFGTYTVKPGQVWLISHFIPYSADSRYFGPLEISRIESPMQKIYPF